MNGQKTTNVSVNYFQKLWPRTEPVLLVLTASPLTQSTQISNYVLKEEECHLLMVYFFFLVKCVLNVYETV